MISEKPITRSEMAAVLKAMERYVISATQMVLAAEQTKEEFKIYQEQFERRVAEYRVLFDRFQTGVEE